MQIRVYYADTDAQGIVYHANYFKFFEVARMEHLRDQGIELPDMLGKYGLHFAMVQAQITYNKPARLNDLLEVKTKITDFGRASVNYEQAIYLHDALDFAICEVAIKLVAVNEEMQVQVIPEQLKQEMVK